MRRWAIPTAFLPLLASCSFLLDFDELQSKGAAGAAGNAAGGADGSASGGTAGTGGGSTTNDASTGGTQADASECPGGCDDNDPCTENLCTAEGCQNPPQPGLVPDGLAQVLTAPAFHRVTMTSRGDRVYLSAFETTTSGPEVVLNSFGKTGTDLSTPVQLTTVGEFGSSVPISAAGMVAPDTGTGLVAYVAVGTTPADPGVVVRLTFGLDLSFVQGQATSTTVADYVGSPQLYPVVWQPTGGEVTAAWPAPMGGVLFHTGTTQITTASGDIGVSEGRVLGLGPLAAGTTPGALYVTETGVHVQALNQLLPKTLTLCDTSAGTFTSATTAFTGLLNGVWMGAWSKQLTTSAVTETRPILCLSGATGSGCGAPEMCGSTGDNVLPGVRNIALSFLSVQGDPPGRVYEISASSFVDSATTEGGISLSSFRADFNLDNPDAGVDAVAVTQTPVELSRMPLGTNGLGPDWPAMALLPPDKFGVAWIQPSESGGDELHIERYRICFPPP